MTSGTFTFGIQKFIKSCFGNPTHSRICTNPFGDDIWLVVLTILKKYEFVNGKDYPIYYIMENNEMGQPWTARDDRWPIHQLIPVTLAPGNAVLSASADGSVRAFDLLRYRNFRTFASPDGLCQPLHLTH